MARRAILLLTALSLPACDRGGDDGPLPTSASGSAGAPAGGGGATPAAPGTTTLNASLGGGQHDPDVPTFARGTATFVLFDDRIDYTYSARDLRGQVMGQVRRGGLGDDGPVLFELPASVGTICSGDLRGFDAVLQAMRAGRTYVNLLSSAFPRGEIRGQIGSVALSARLRAARQRGARGEGRATFSINGTQDRIAFELEVDGLSGPTIGAKIRVGPDGPLLFELATGPFDSPLRGTLTAEDVRPSSNVVNFADAVDVLLSGDAWVLVRTTTHPDAEVRGRIGKSGGGHDDD